MNKTCYLYGAAVQGIQSFIFQSNELSEIGAASAMVDKVCKNLFAECLYGKAGTDSLQNDPDAIINAAGNVKYLFKDKDTCEKVVREFPKRVTAILPGISISQAVVEVLNPSDAQEQIESLEQKLRIQRNKPMRSTTLGFLGVIRSRRTGLPAVDVDNKNGDLDFRDLGTVNKQLFTKKNDIYEKALGISVPQKKLPWNISDIEGFHSWIAIIHADGNNLGQVVRKIGHDIETYKAFSRQLEKDTQRAANKAYAEISASKDISDKEIVPIRPVVLGGDDLTVICRADLALEFAKLFISYFENETRNSIVGQILKQNKVFRNENNLTACAGIAFIKSSFPFYYGYDLAEDLCKEAKLDAREIAGVGCATPSCIMFHKVQDSFIVNYSDIKERELTLEQNKTFKNGPYYLNMIPNRWDIDKLENCVNQLIKQNNTAKNGVRQWISFMADGQFGPATQRLKRLLQIQQKSEGFINGLTMGLERKYQNNKIEYCYPAYDVLSLSSIYQKAD